MPRFGQLFVLLCFFATPAICQTPFPAATGQFKELGTLQNQNVTAHNGVIQLAPTQTAVSTLGGGWAAAVPQFWVTPEGVVDLALRGMFLPPWVQVMDPEEGMANQTGTDLLNEFTGRMPRLNVTSASASAQRHIGGTMLSRMFGDGPTVSIGQFLQAAQPMTANASALPWNVLGVPHWSASALPAQVWGSSFNQMGVNTRQEINSVRLAQNVALVEAPTLYEGYNFVRGPEFFHLWDIGEIGVSVQWICLRDDTPSMLEAGDVAALLSDPIWVTPAGGGGGQIQLVPSYTNPFGLQFFPEGYFVVTTAIVYPAQALLALDEEGNVLTTIPLVPSVLAGVYLQLTPPMPPGVVGYALEGVPLPPTLPGGEE